MLTRSITTFAWIFLLALLISMPIQANTEQTFQSGSQQVSLLELYTSEGCSSCPPADRWLSGLKQDSRLWKELIPLAFHVDYWDYIGWKDPFASSRFSQRQRLYARQNHLSTVYTPGLLLNGEEWRAWFYQRSIPSQQEKSGQLRLEMKNNRIDANYTPLASQLLKQGLVLNIAVLGFDLKSAVDAGENKGRELRHDFVVLGHKMVKMENLNSAFQAKQIILPKLSHTAEKQALVAWVNPIENLKPLQATGGWIKQ